MEGRAAQQKVRRFKSRAEPLAEKRTYEFDVLLQRNGMVRDFGTAVWSYATATSLKLRKTAHHALGPKTRAGALIGAARLAFSWPQGSHALRDSAHSLLARHRQPYNRTQMSSCHECLYRSTIMGSLSAKTSMSPNRFLPRSGQLQTAAVLTILITYCLRELFEAACRKSLRSDL